MEPIPFNRAVLAGNEFVYLRQAINGMHIAGAGSYTKACEEHLERVLGCRRALLTPSCTHALEMAAILLEVGSGDEVIMPSFTFVSTANAFVLRGARPVFVDVRPDTLNLDEARLEAAMTPRTRAIVVVHYAGVSCNMDPILALARSRNIPVVEDNAHGLFGRYRGIPLGTQGSLGTLSFHETKNITCGEGGALLINDERLVDRAEIIRDKGTDRGRFLRGEVDKYTWVDIGSSYLMSDLLAGFLLAQLEASSSIQADRRRIWDMYCSGLADWARDNGVKLPSTPSECDPSFHLFYLVMPSPEAQGRLLDHLRGQGIHAIFHYLPLHLSRMGRSYGYREHELPVTEQISRCLVRLPFYRDLLSDAQARVIKAILACPI